MNVQDECIKIHSKFGMSEMANYKIQLLFDSEIEKVKKEYEEKVNELLSALEQIANATQPFNAFENEVFVSVATDIARKALSFYNATNKNISNNNK